MFEFAKLLFIAMLLIAASMIKPGLKDLKKERQLNAGDTTNIFKRDIEWEQKFEKAIQEAVVKTDKKFGVDKYKNGLNQIINETTSDKNSKSKPSSSTSESRDNY